MKKRDVYMKISEVLMLVCMVWIFGIFGSYECGRIGIESSLKMNIIPVIGAMIAFYLMWVNE